MADKYANIGYADVDESAANTLTFSEIETGVSMFEKNAWVIHELEWWVPTSSVALLLAYPDTITMALVASNKLSSIHLNDAAVIDMYEIQYHEQGTEANYLLTEMPVRRDFTNLPGGGLIVTPRPLYVAAQGNSLATVSTIRLRFYFSIVSLKAEEYWELVEARRLVE